MTSGSESDELAVEEIGPEMLWKGSVSCLLEADGDSDALEGLLDGLLLRFEDWVAVVESSTCISGPAGVAGTSVIAGFLCKPTVVAF